MDHAPPRKPDPWDFMQPHDVARFGAAILDPAERGKWCTATLIGGLPYMWKIPAATIKTFMYAQMKIKPGDKVLILGESIASSGFAEDVAALVGPGGEVETIDIIEAARDATVANLRGRSGKRGTWRYDYADRFADAHFDCIGVLQGVQHSDDWHSAGIDLLRIMKPAGVLMLAEIVFGPRIRELAAQDLHMQYWFDKLTFGANVPNLELSYYSAEELRAALGDVLVDPQSFEWRGLELFWGRKPG
jgi:SAM-dependent methyltransferase